MTTSIPIVTPSLIVARGSRAQMRFQEFFVAQIRNPHTRPDYGTFYPTPISSSIMRSA